MTARSWVWPRRLLLVLDLAAAFLAVPFAWGWLWGVDYRAHVGAGTPPLAHEIVFAGFALVTVLLLARSGQYSARRRISRIDDGIGLVKALLVAVLLVLGLAILTKGFGTGFTNYSRRVLLLDVAALFVFMVAARLVAQAWQQRLFVRRDGLRRVLVAGTGATASVFERFLARRRWLGYGLAGYVAVLDEATAADRLGGLPRFQRVRGGIAQLPAALQATGAGEVVVALDDDEQARFPELLAALHAAAVPFRVMPAMFERGYRQAQAAGMEGLSTVSLVVDPMDRAQRALKRVGDVVVSGAFLVLLSPLLLAVALAIVLTSRGGPFYSQPRVGTHGRVFRMYKFRTMYRDADRRWEELRCENDCDPALFKIKDDPRITPVGRLLRRYSVDELPQFFNVLRGDMSVVGPRPPLPSEVEAYDTAHLARLKGRPGITGLWQVSGRSDLPFDKMVDLDTYYLEHWSLGLDLSIMLRTAAVVLRGSGRVLRDGPGAAGGRLLIGLRAPRVEPHRYHTQGER